MNILGIETSCDETAAAVVTSEGVVLSSVISSQIPLHARYGGVIPEIASRNHLLSIETVVSQALRDARVEPGEVSRIGVTVGPGLIGALMVGLQFAKGLARSYGWELTPVHHVEGHITAALLADGAQHPHAPLEFPYVALAVSGGHTSIYLVKAPGDYGLLAVTLDDAAGEAFDKVARLLGLPYPGGVEIDRLARQGDREAVPFPRPLCKRADLKKGNLDFSFSGLKTAVRVYLEKAALAPTEQQLPLAAVAASFQEAVVDVLTLKTLEAARRHGVGHVVLAGGVAANSRLREKAVEAAASGGIAMHLTKLPFCTDNAAMIAGAARFGRPLPPDRAALLEPFASGQLVRLSP